MSVALSWREIGGDATYEAEYCEGTSGSWSSDDDDITGGSHTVDGLDCNTSCQFRVRAYGDGDRYAAKWGSYSSVRTARTVLCAPPPPSGLSADPAGTTTVELSWSEIGGDATYEAAYRKGTSGSWISDADDIDGAATRSVGSGATRPTRSACAPTETARPTQPSGANTPRP